MVRILVTGVGGPAGSSLARQLRALGHWVGGVDLNPAAATHADGFSVVPPAGDARYLPELRRLARIWGCELLIPTVSDELVMVSAVAGSFGLPVLVAPEDPVRQANDKFLTMTALAAQSVPVPKSGLPSEFSSLRHASAMLGGDLVAKPRVSRGGRGVRVLEEALLGSEEALAFQAALDDSWILQAFAPGTEYAPVVFAPRPGEVSFVAVLEKTALKEGRVGNAVAVRRVNDDGVAGLARDTVLALGLTGPVDLDVRRRADGIPVVLEVNARFGANSAWAPELLNAALARFLLPASAA